MKRNILTLIAVLSLTAFSSFNGFAQKSKNSSSTNSKTKNVAKYPRGFRVGFGLTGGIPTDNEYEAALGADARLQYDLTRKTSLTATTGYTHLFQKGNDAGFIPAKLGFKAFWGTQFYAQGEVGAAFGVNGSLDNSLLLSPSFGFANKFIDVSIRYENYTDYNTDMLGIRVAYGFSLKKKK